MSDGQQLAQRLCRLCNTLNVPLGVVANDALGCSRISVYRWAAGTRRCRKSNVILLEAVINLLEYVSPKMMIIDLAAQPLDAAQLGDLRDTNSGIFLSALATARE